MAEYYNIFYPYIVPISFIVGSIFLGIIFESIVLARLKKIALQTTWEGDDIIIESLQGRTKLWFIIGGLYGALHSFPLEKSLLTVSTKFLIVILIFSVTLLIAKIVVDLLQLSNHKKHNILPETSIIANIIRFIIILLGILIIFQYLGVSITPILTALGVGGLAVALALQDTLSNLFAGIQIIASKQIQLNDYVKLDSGEEGHVRDITWRNTTIESLYYNTIVIPNSKLASTIITNFHLSNKKLTIPVEVGVSYDSDLEHVEQVTLDVAQKTLQEVDEGISDFVPIIRFVSFADFSINFKVLLQASNFPNQFILKSEFIKRLHRRYKEDGIEIPFPIRTVHMKEK